VPHYEEVDLRSAVWADNAAFAVVPEIPPEWPNGGHPGLWIAFSFQGRPYPPVLLLGEPLTAVIDAVKEALVDLPAPVAPPLVLCPGCGGRLFGSVAARGACLACFPPLPEATP